MSIEPTEPAGTHVQAIDAAVAGGGNTAESLPPSAAASTDANAAGGGTALHADAVAVAIGTVHEGHHIDPPRDPGATDLVLGHVASATDWRMPESAFAVVAGPGRQKPATRAYYSAQAARTELYSAAHAMLATRDAGGVLQRQPSKEESSRERTVQRIIQLAFAINVVLFLLKVAAAAYSGSVAVIGSAIDSSMDVFSGSILFVAARIASKRDPVRFPVGKTRLEPLAIVIFACVMCMAALQLFVAAAQDIIAGVAEGPGVLVIDALPLAALAAAVVSKSAVLCLSCRYRSSSASIEALQKDAVNDVVTNAAAILAVVVASRVSAAWWLDPAFGMALACMIVATWSVTIKEFVYALSGETGAQALRLRPPLAAYHGSSSPPLPPAADPETVSQLIFLAANHDKRVTHVESLVAYHVGTNVIVEVNPR